MQRPDGGDRLKLHRLEYLPMDGFTPSPNKIFTEIVELPGSTARSAVIHGSFVYTPDDVGVICSTYCDTRVFSNGEFVESRLDLVKQRPDIDGIVVVEDRASFEEAFTNYARENELSEQLQYFFTLNVVDEATVRSEIAQPHATAMKTIFALRKLLSFGDSGLNDELVALAQSVITDEDRAFQTQYDSRKALFRTNSAQDVTSFVITRAEYEENYPLLLASYEGKIHAGFPPTRTKIVLPRSMGIKRRLDLNPTTGSDVKLVELE